MGSRVLITGGAGFIGSNLADRLVQDGFNVRILDDLSTGNEKYLSAIRNDVELLTGDIRDQKITKRAMKGVEVVFHQAAARSVLRSVEDPEGTNSINVNGTLNVLQAAREAGVRRLVYASTSSVYGDNPELPKREDMLPMPRSPYAVGKLAAEHYCQVYSHLYGLETVSLRYFNVFGQRQDPNSQYSAVIPLFVAALLRKERPVIHGDGSQSRDFTHIDNVVEANVRAMESARGSGQAFNIACGEQLRIDDLARKLMGFLEVEVELDYTETRAGDVRHTLADISKAKELLGYEPVINTEEGLRRAAAWYVSEAGVHDQQTTQATVISGS